jgi:phage terminase large subunit-like protein
MIYDTFSVCFLSRISGIRIFKMKSHKWISKTFKKDQKNPEKKLFKWKKIAKFLGKGSETDL